VPELPEVETTRRGIAPHITGRRIEKLAVHDRRLRWPVSRALPEWAQGQTIQAVRRRAKYLVIQLERGYLLLHLGMSGSLLILPESTALDTHDHFDVILDSQWTLRFNDPRRFGSLHHAKGTPDTHPLLRNLAPEPLGQEFDSDYLFDVTRKRRVSIKQLIMNSALVVGVGNIYASEALFRAGVRPRRAAGRIKPAEWQRIVESIRQVLGEAIRQGGTTLRDYVNADGTPGYFRQQLFVYERAGEPCRRCETPIRHLVQGQRSTYFCPVCQK
jgi:formamidopyrimidine-DNA glycosylase